MLTQNTKLPLIIVAAYRVFPRELFESILSSGVPVAWHIHYHGPHEHIAEQLLDFVGSQPAAVLFDHRENRGLARSWNDSLRLLPRGKHDLAFLINDDLSFITGGFADFFSFIKEKEEGHNAAAFYSLPGNEIGDSALAGTVHIQGMACCALNTKIVQTIGLFDETFTPAYFEDCDYFRRIRLSNVPIILDSRILCSHERSSTLRGDDKLKAQSVEWWDRNKAYYLQKWGGEPDKETYDVPFVPNQML